MPHLCYKTIDDVVLLEFKVSEVVDKKEQVRTRRYTYTEIRELQSKLTLVAGDKQRENRETIEVFDEASLQSKGLSLPINCQNKRQ